LERRYRIGIDVGGTFTDGVLIDEKTGKIFTSKVLSTPRDPSIGFLESMDLIIKQYEIDPTAIWLVVHGTTVATNSIIERKVSKSALIVTKGFKDILEIAFQIRPKLYDVFVEKPKPLIPRNLCFEIFERIGPDGEIINNLSEKDLYRIKQLLIKNEIKSVGVCLLHSYINNSNERIVGNFLRKEIPDVPITLSSEILPEFREYPRASTTVINSVLRPIFSNYINKIDSGIINAGIKCGCFLMQSNGGVVTTEVSRNEPVRIIESGPAAGVLIASFIANLTGNKNAISIDMGGTTAKMGIVLDGQPRISRELEVGAKAFSRGTATRGSGYPLRTPTIDLVEIGAGGGSIAWVDSGGILRVGPQSAGADPGPACYPEGGKEPTITDANLILRRLNKDFFLGGKMKLRYENAVSAVNENCAKKIGVDIYKTSSGIINLAVLNMVNAIRFISVEKGYDPREFSLIATGGAGPLHANIIAKELDIPLVIIPTNPGVASGFGLLISDIKHEYSKTVLNFKNLNNKTVEKIFKELFKEGINKIKKQGIIDSDTDVDYSADMRYRGQSYELEVKIDGNLIKKVNLNEIKNLFHDIHKRAYGFCSIENEVEIVNLRVTVYGKMIKYEPETIKEGSAKPELSADKGKRKVYFEKFEKFVDCSILDRKKLLKNNEVFGPAVIEEENSSTVIIPGYFAHVDKWGNLIIKKYNKKEA